jgi:prohibitin 2
MAGHLNPEKGRIMDRGYWFGIIGSIALVLFIILVPAQCRIIRPGERGVIVTWGKVEPKVWTEGLHVKRPFSQKVVRVDIKIQKIQVDASAASKDLQEINAEVALNYHLDPAHVGDLINDIGADFKKIIIEPAIAEVTKQTTAKYTAEEMITARERVRADVRAALGTRLLPYFIIVDDFSFMNFDFSEQFNRAIEEKQTAAQNALKAERDLVRIKTEAEQTIATAEAAARSKVLNAEAEAESLRLQRQVLTPELIQLRAIEKWNGVLPTYSGSGAVPFLNLR